MFEDGQRVDEQVAMGIADYFMDNIKIDDTPLRNIVGMKKQPKTMRTYEITYDGLSPNEIEDWMWNNVGWRVEELNRDIEDFGREVERKMEGFGE